MRQITLQPSMSVLVSATVRSVGIKKMRITQAATQLLRWLHEPEASLSVHFVGEDRMRTLNRIHRGLDRPTDVLSFSFGEEGHDGRRQRDLGDLFLCVPYLRRQARAFGVAYEEEVLRMLAHGVLHLAGFDHEKPHEARRMFGLQEKFLSRLLSSV